MAKLNRELSILSDLSCTLPEGEAGVRRAEVGKLFAQSLSAVAIDDGVELEYSGDDDTARALLDFVLFERRCCAQLSYELRFLPNHQTVRLRVTGAPEYVAAIREWAV